MIFRSAILTSKILPLKSTDVRFVFYFFGGGGEGGTRVRPWQIHVDVWQNQYNIVK